MPTMAHPSPSPPIASITFAATTEENTSTDPIDRSMPEVMITKVIPTPSTAQMETFWVMIEKFDQDKEFGRPR